MFIAKLLLLIVNSILIGIVAWTICNLKVQVFRHLIKRDWESFEHFGAGYVADVIVGTTSLAILIIGFNYLWEWKV